MAQSNFVILILGRTCHEWDGIFKLNSGRAGFNKFGSPVSLVSTLEHWTHDESVCCFNKPALLSSQRVDLILIDCCQPSIEMIEVGSTEQGRAVFMDSRRLDFNDITQLDTLPQCHLILHDKRTLGIFAYTECIPFLVKEKLFELKGSFLIHGLKPDPLYDIIEADRAYSISQLPPPLSTEQTGHRAGADDSEMNIFQIMVELFEDIDGEHIENGDDVQFSDKIDKDHQKLHQFFLPCHPKDSLEDIRLRLYRKIQTLSLDIEVPIGFELRYKSIQSHEDVEEGENHSRLEIESCPRIIPAKSFTRPFVWFSGKYPTLLDALTSANLDTSGNDVFSMMLRFSTPMVSTTTVVPICTDHHEVESMSNLPVLHPHGSSGLPLRSFALADSFNALRCPGSPNCLLSTPCLAQQTIYKPNTNLFPEAPIREPLLAMKLFPSLSCPMTEIRGIAAFHCHENVID